MNQSPAVLEVKDAVKRFIVRKRGMKVDNLAVNHVSLSIRKGEIYGLVGESGSGKSTLAKLVMGLELLNGGEITYDEAVIAASGRKGKFPYGKIQIVFQDPRSSLDPRMRVRDIVKEPLRLLTSEKRDTLGSEHGLISLFHKVGLREEHLDRYPHEFSGGQRQRIAIARALITQPSVVILDEPTSALDVSVQAQVINLLKSLKNEQGLTYLFISHNIGIVRYFCERIGVLYQGELLEEGPAERIFSSPQHEYTKKLLASVPSIYDTFPNSARTAGQVGKHGV